MSEISPLNHFQTSLQPHFPHPSKSLGCKYLPWAILTSHDKAASLISSCKLTKKYTELKKIGLMHLAALSDNVDLIKRLCGESKDTLPKDQEGNTPLHFRAMVSQEANFKSDPFYQNYVSSCKLTSKQITKLNTFGGSAEKLHALANSVLNAQKNQPHTAEGENSHSKIVTMSPHIKFHEKCLSRFKYTPKMLTTSQALVDHWLHFPSDGQKKYQKDRLYNDFLKNRPQLLVREVQMGCGVFAQSEIPAGAIASNFNGEYIVDKKISEIKNQPVSEYFFGHDNTATYREGTEPLTYRGEGAMINDGPPNLIAKGMRNQESLAVQTTFVSLGIQPGEELNFDYGPTQNIKYLDYQLGNLDRLRGALTQKKYPLGDFPKYNKQLIIENMNPQNGSIDENFSNSDQDLINAMVTFLYVMTTPKALFKMIQEGAISSSEMRQILLALLTGEFQGLIQTPLLVGNVINGFLLAYSREQLVARGEEETFHEIMKGIDKHYARFMAPHLEDAELFGRILFIDAHARFFNVLASYLSKDEIIDPETFVEGYASTDNHADKTSEEKELLQVSLSESFEEYMQQLVGIIASGKL